ncbi:MAG: GGDEF domain-containing protein, partial [Firmicutes bacterium]|nr:GGDEF domain-containing protein [Bacillota bacterium]
PGLRFSEGLVSGELGALWGVSRAFLEERIEVQVRERLAALDLGKGIWFTIAETLPEEQLQDALTFSAWYEDLNWLITMGVHRGELERYVAQTAETGGRLAVLLSVRLVLILVLVVIAAVALVLLVEHLFFRQHTAQLELQINEDLLTGAKSRRCGVQVLSEAFAAFQAGNSSPEIFMFDVDRLKEINDCFGHSAGDKLLQAVAGEVRRVLGGAGEIIRWGGDEFVVLAPAGGQGQKLADRIVQSISALEFRFDQEAVRASISLGAARFQKGDASFREALERADHKLYEMKRSGKTEVH